MPGGASDSASGAVTSTLKRIPRSIWALGFVSMLMDISSEMIHSLLPVFLTTVMGVGALTVGLIEGVAEATALHPVKSARFAIQLRKKASRFRGGGRGHNAGKNRQREHDRSDGLHGVFSVVDQ